MIIFFMFFHYCSANLITFKAWKLKWIECDFLKEIKKEIAKERIILKTS